MQRVLVRTVGLVVATGLLMLARGASAQISPVSITVNVVGSTDTDRAKLPKRGGGIVPKVTVTQERQLEIKLANRRPGNLDDVTVRYFLFAKSVEDKEIILLRTGRRRVSLAPLQTETVKTEMVTTSHTDQYSKKSQGKVVFVPPTGQKFAGYAVQVWQGDRLVGELYEPPEMKASVATASVQAEDEDAPKTRRRRSD
jgi:hypothetical protein